jgi:hypothetical protein
MLIWQILSFPVVLRSLGNLDRICWWGISTLFSTLGNIALGGGGGRLACRKASTYTEQHNEEIRGQKYMP